MNVFSTVSNARLVFVLPETRAAAYALLAAADPLRIDFGIPAFGGARTNDDQRQLEDWRKESGEQYAVATPGNSFHEYGAAFDVSIVGYPNAYAPGADAKYRALADAAAAIGLRPGYYFRSRKDPYHFELAIPLATAQARWRAFATTAGSSAVVAAVALVGIVLFLSRRKG